MLRSVDVASLFNIITGVIGMKDKIFGVLQRVGRSFMLPIALLPVAGLLLGIGSSFTNPTTIETYGLGGIIYKGGILYTILDVMSRTGSVVFDNLPLLFAMGVAIGMAKKEKEVAALSGAIGYLVMNTAIAALITAKGGADAMADNSTASVLGITTLQMGVFGGIIVGLGTAALHNRFYKIQLPQVLSFFGGTRFVPIVTGLVYLVVGVVMFYLWPVVQTGIAQLGKLVLESGYVGTWIYGVIERALIPFGLHHVFYMPFWQTELGGAAVVDGSTVFGAQNIFFAELASHGTEHFSVSATRFMSGKFPFMIFGLPAAAYAMYSCARPEKKKAVGGLLLSAALTSMVTGITEPLEFTFLFAAPVAYGVHCVLAGLSYMLMHLLDVGVGMTFSGGAIDLVLFGVLQGNEKTNWLWIVAVGAVYAVVYYFIFVFMIKRFNLRTPGREAEGEEVRLYTRSDYEKNRSVKSGDFHDKVSELIVRGLGGKDNISDIDCCATRLRVSVFDADAVQEKLLSESGASGVIHKGNGVQIVYGPQVSVVKSRLDEYLDNSDSTQNIWSFDDKKEFQTKGTVPNIEKTGSPKKKGGAITLFAPARGEIVPLCDVQDEAFSSGVLGGGIAIDPIAGELFSPCEGRVEMISDTLHAVNLVSEDGCEVLLHIGIDTVRLGGRFFTAHIADGQLVKQGEKLVSFDIEGIRSAGFSAVTIMAVTNSDEFSAVKPIASGTADAQTAVVTVER